MAKTRIWRERDHPRDNRGRFAERGGSNWIARVAKQFEASFGDTSAGEGGHDPRLGGRLQTGPGGLLDIGGMSAAAKAKFPRKPDGSRQGMAGAIRDAAQVYRARSSQGELNAETNYRQRLADRLTNLAGRVESGDTSAGEARGELGRMGRSMAGLPYKNLSNGPLVSAQKALRDGERSDLGLDRPAPPGAKLPVPTRAATQRVELRGLQNRSDQEIQDLIDQRRGQDSLSARSDLAQLEQEQTRRRVAAERTVEPTDSFLERMSAKAAAARAGGAAQPAPAVVAGTPQWGTMKSAGVKNGDLVVWGGIDRAAPKEGQLVKIEGNGSFYRLVDPQTGDRVATWGGVAAKGWIAKADTPVDTGRAGGYNGGMDTTSPTQEKVLGPAVVSPPRPYAATGTVTDETPVALRPLRDKVWEANTKKDAMAVLRDADQAQVGQLADHFGVARTRAAVADAVRNGVTAEATKVKTGPQDLTPAMQGMLDRIKRGDGSISFRLNSSSRRFATVSPSDRVVLQGLERRGLVRNTGSGLDFKYELVKPDAGVPSPPAAASVAAHVRPKPVTGPSLPGKKVAIKGVPEGIQIRDAGQTDYKGDKVYTIYDAQGNEMGTLQKVTRTSAVKAPGSRIASGFRKSTEWEATAKGGTTSRERGTGYTAADALSRMPTREQIDAARERRRAENAGAAQPQAPSRSEVSSAVGARSAPQPGQAMSSKELLTGDKVDVNGQTRTVSQVYPDGTVRFQEGGSVPPGTPARFVSRVPSVSGGGYVGGPPASSAERFSADELSAALNRTTQDAIRRDAAMQRHSDLFNDYGPQVAKVAQKLVDNWLKGLLTDDDLEREMQVERVKAQGKA